MRALPFASTDDSRAVLQVLHLALTSDGTAVAPGLNLYVDGQRQTMKVLVDFLTLNPAVRDPFRIGGAAGDHRQRQDHRARPDAGRA
jgi:hypothetical protein